MWKETHWKDGPDSLTDMSPERNITRSIWKMFLTVESVKYKLNQIPLHTYNGQNPGWQQQMLVRMWTRKDTTTHSPLLLGTQNSKLLRKSLAVSYPTKHTFINKSNNWLLESPQRSRKLAPTKQCNRSDQQQTRTLVTTCNHLLDFWNHSPGRVYQVFSKINIGDVYSIFLFNEFLVFIISSFSLKTIDAFLRMVFKSWIFALSHF